MNGGFAGLWAGIAIIAATNVVVLAGAAYNRSGPPDATLHLTQRELAVPYAGGLANEDSGLALRLEARTDWTPHPEALATDAPYWQGGAPDWLDETKLKALGVDVARLRAPGDAARGGAPTATSVLLVLEQNGPAYASALAQARQRADENATLAKAHPDNAELAKRAARAAEAATREAETASRLFIVDAGLDHDALRAAHPDAQRYAIARGIIQPLRLRNGKPGAYIRGLAVDEIRVESSQRGAFAAAVAAERARSSPGPNARFDASVAWGRRLEPWIAAAVAKP